MNNILKKIGPRERTGLHAILFIIVLLLVSMILEGCIDTCETKNVYAYYEPVYTSLEDLRSAVKSEEPRNLKQLGKLYLKDNYIYINEPGEGLHVINNQNPSNPINISFINIPGNFSLSAKGNFLYVDSYVDLVVLDISNPESIKEVNRLDEIFSDYNSYGFYIDSELGVVTDWKLVENVEVYESDCDQLFPNYREGILYDNVGGYALASGTKISASAPSTSAGIGGSMATFTIYDNYLYTIDQSDLTIINISNLSTPLVHSKEYIGWGIETLFPYGNKLFIGANNGMYIYDNVNPADPELLTLYQHMTSCDPVVVQGDYAYVTLRSGNTCGGFSNQLEVINISDIVNPKLEEIYPMYNPHGLGIDGNALFICDGQAGLKIYDASDIHALGNNLKAQYPNIHALDVIPFNNVLMMIGEDGLFQYDYTNLESIVLLSEIRTVADN
ncbi:MAG: hypothetical protein OEW67_05295 [Cyclobacteriaceae bacterium]|nr:hypothetical protein [Cyclobacteriaceae bacterium]